MPKPFSLPIDTELQDMILDFMLAPEEAIKCAVAWSESGLVWDEVRALPPTTKRRLAATIVTVWAGMETGHYYTENSMKLNVKLMLEKIIIGMFVHSDRQSTPMPSAFDELDLKGEENAFGDDDEESNS
jgi:hypothetical protein